MQACWPAQWAYCKAVCSSRAWRRRPPPHRGQHLQPMAGNVWLQAATCSASSTCYKVCSRFAAAVPPRPGKGALRGAQVGAPRTVRRRAGGRLCALPLACSACKHVMAHLHLPIRRSCVREDRSCEPCELGQSPRGWCDGPRLRFNRVPHCIAMASGGGDSMRRLRAVGAAWARLNEACGCRRVSWGGRISRERAKTPVAGAVDVVLHVHARVGAFRL